MLAGEGKALKALQDNEQSLWRRGAVLADSSRQLIKRPLQRVRGSRTFHGPRSYEWRLPRGEKAGKGPEKGGGVSGKHAMEVQHGAFVKALPRHPPHNLHGGAKDGSRAMSHMQSLRPSSGRDWGRGEVAMFPRRQARGVPGGSCSMDTAGAMRRTQLAIAYLISSSQW